MFRANFWSRSRVSLLAFLAIYIFVAGFLIFQVVLVLSTGAQRLVGPILLLAIALFLLVSAQFRPIFLIKHRNQLHFDGALSEQGAG